MAALRQARSLLRNVLSRQSAGLNTSVRAFATEVVKDGEIGIVSGVPVEHLGRKVYIYVPARTASQQGGSKSNHWKIRFDSTQKWENPLMGWTSTGDPLSHVGDSALYFNSKEAAIDFARRHGWEYNVLEPKEMIKKPKVYADNYKWRGPVPSAGED